MILSRASLGCFFVVVNWKCGLDWVAVELCFDGGFIFGSNKINSFFLYYRYRLKRFKLITINFWNRMRLIFYLDRCLLL